MQSDRIYRKFNQRRTHTDYDLILALLDAISCISVLSTDVIKYQPHSTLAILVSRTQKNLNHCSSYEDHFNKLVREIDYNEHMSLLECLEKMLGTLNQPIIDVEQSPLLMLLQQQWADHRYCLNKCHLDEVKINDNDQLAMDVDMTDENIPPSLQSIFDHMYVLDGCPSCKSKTIAEQKCLFTSPLCFVVRINEPFVPNAKIPKFEKLLLVPTLDRDDIKYHFECQICYNTLTKKHKTIFSVDDTKCDVSNSENDGREIPILAFYSKSSILTDDTEMETAHSNTYIKEDGLIGEMISVSEIFSETVTPMKLPSKACASYREQEITEFEERFGSGTILIDAIDASSHESIDTQSSENDMPQSVKPPSSVITYGKSSQKKISNCSRTKFVTGQDLIRFAKKSSKTVNDSFSSTLLQSSCLSSEKPSIQEKKVSFPSLYHLYREPKKTKTIIDIDEIIIENETTASDIDEQIISEPTNPEKCRKRVLKRAPEPDQFNDLMRLDRPRTRSRIASEQVGLEDVYMTDDKAELLQTGVGVNSPVVMTVMGINITQEHVDRLLDCRGWLTSQIIDARLAQLQRKYPNNFYFNTSFFALLCNDPVLYDDPGKGIIDYMRVAGWTKPKRLPGLYESLFDFTRVFIPINEGGVHWILVAVDLNRMVISFFNSLSSDGSRYVKAVKDYLEAELVARGGGNSGVNLGGFHLQPETPENVPRQRNNSDCGVLMLYYIEVLSESNSKTSEFKALTQEDIRKLRIRIIEHLNKDTKPEEDNSIMLIDSEK